MAMISFRPVRMTPPASAADLSGGMAAALDAVGGSLSGGMGGIDNLGLPSPPSLPDLPGSPPDAATLRRRQSALLSRKARFLCLSPYNYGVGQRRGEAAWLTPEALLVEAALRVGELDDIPGLDLDRALLLIITAAPEQDTLAQACDAMSRAFPMPEVQRLARRSRGVANLERDKFTIPPTPSAPAWGESSPERLPVSRETARLLGAGLAQAEGREAAAKDPAAVLADFGQRREARMRNDAAALRTIMGSLQGEGDLTGWYGIYLEGLAAECARLLARVAPPLDAAYKCAACLVWYGSVEEVAYYKELFNI